MRGIGIVGCGALLLTAAVLGTPARADDKANPFEAYEKAAKPGPQHQLLASMAGSWTFTMKFWMEPGKEPSESAGTSENKMILDGRYLLQDVSCDLLGKPFKGRGLNGYDNVQGKYVGMWIDNMSTGMATSVGAADKDGKVLTYDREETDPLTKAKSKCRDVVRIVDENKHTLEMYKTPPDGKEFKTMEITYTRKAGPGKAAK